MVEGTQLAALIASKICHDISNPVNAFGQGLEMMRDPAMQDDALPILDQSARQANAKVEFYRFAVGGAVVDGEGELDEVKPIAEVLFSALTPDLAWNAPAGVRLPRTATRVVAHLLYIAGQCLPRGGKVELSSQGGQITISATGDRVVLKDDTVKALRGEEPESGWAINAQPLFAGVLATQAGLDLAINKGDGRVDFVARAPAIRLAA